MRDLEERARVDKAEIDRHMTSADAMETPASLFGDLFEAVQMSGLFADSKTFADAIPRTDPARICQLYVEEQQRPDFDLAAFVAAHFQLPQAHGSDFVADPERPAPGWVLCWWRLAGGRRSATGGPRQRGL